MPLVPELRLLDLYQIILDAIQNSFKVGFQRHVFGDGVAE